MTDLLDDLKDDHKLILEILDQVKALGIATATGREKLLSARDVLLSHMEKEDQLFYPALREAAKQNDDLGRVLSYFSEDMDRVSLKAMDVFNKYSGGASAEDFPGEITLLYITLKDRIRTEEEILFRRYEQLEG